MDNIGYKDLYRDYPFKCQLLITNTVPDPYIKKEDQNCDSEYRLTYLEWKKIIDLYVEYVIDYLKTGDVFKLPFRLGNLRLIQNPKKFFLNFNTGKEERRTTPIGFYLLWKRQSKDNGLFTHKWNWRVRLGKYAWRYLDNYFTENPSKLNNLHKKVYK